MDIRTEASVRIDATPEAVFSFVGDPSTHGSWSAKAPLQVRKLGEDPIAVGTEFESTSKFLGKPVTARLRITRYDPPKSVAFVAEHPEGTYGHEFTLDDADGGTLVTRAVSIPRGSGLRSLLAKYIAPGAIRKEATQALHKLKQQVESAGS